MNPAPPDSNDAEEFDAEELESATSERVTPDQPPEVSKTTEELTAWDEPSHIAGGSAPKIPMEDEAPAAEKLIEEGMDEADREQRMAAADPDFEP